MVRNSAQLNQEITPCEIDAMAILRSSDFAAGVSRWGHFRRIELILFARSSPLRPESVAEVRSRSIEPVGCGATGVRAAPDALE